jgi:pyruvate dehydrogenase complex dehydrogenase (E1) component
VRGNGKIIQELETVFRGAGWNVIKVIWGRRWDPLLELDREGLLVQRMNEAVDGEYQVYKARNGAYVREHFFGRYPQLREMVDGMSDEEIWALNRGGHDPYKVYAAYAAAVHTQGRPTVILAKTIKGYGMGEAGEGQNITHQQKKMTGAALLAFRDRFQIPISDEQVAEAAFYKPAEDSAEMHYLREHREHLGRAAAPAPAHGGAARGPAAVGLRGSAQGHRRASGVDHHGLRPDPQHARARQAARLAHRPDRARRVAHVRHGGHVPPARHLQPGRPALPA